MKNTDLLCEIGLKYERNMGYQNMGGGQKYQSKEADSFDLEENNVNIGNWCEKMGFT